MAKSRDRVTRLTRQIAKRNNINPQRIRNLSTAGQGIVHSDGTPLNSGEKAAYRVRGRRGVRARARKARIEARKANNTYVAPGNSDVKKGSGS